MGYQVPLRVFTGVYEDLTNPDNDLLGFFAQIDPGAVGRILGSYQFGLGPEGYGPASCAGGPSGWGAIPPGPGALGPVHLPGSAGDGGVPRPAPPLR